ncbi:hypothetical protein [Actinophytocola sp.]|uniref:hypothetical protein n=1 Tax=Actinophytocola sp. TaxID=1872138 RepID=UPI002ED26CEE
MIKDPLTAWQGQFPYDALAPVGITPQSSQAEVKDASYALMTGKLMREPAVQKAWDELRDPLRRLMVDIQLYNLDPVEEAGKAMARVEAERAAIGEPPELADAFTMPTDLLDELTGELTPVHPEPPPPVVAPPDLAAFPPLPMVNRLIRFDR